MNMETYPTISRAAVLPLPNRPPEIRAYTIPQLVEGSVLIRTIASEICGTDVHLWHGKLSGVPYPLIPGHVSVGEVVAQGGSSGILDIDQNPIQVGDTITFLDVHGTCNNCYYCLVAKTSTRCPHRKVYGITFGADESPGLSGGWSEYIYLRPGTKLIRLSHELDPFAWIGAGCGLPTAVHAIDLAQIRLGDSVLVQGAGPVGLSVAALALLSGAGWVGVLDAHANRLEAAHRIGVDWTKNIATTDSTTRHAELKRQTGGRGADIVIEASGNPNAVREGCELARDGGRYVIVGQYTDHGDIPINPHLHINKKHLEVRGCWGSDFSHVYRATQLVQRYEHRIHWKQLISRQYSLTEVEQGLLDVQAGKVVKAVIVP